MRSTGLLVCLILSASLLPAQWLNRRTPGIARLPDGSPNMVAPAPRTAAGKPDLSGMWRILGSNLGSDVTRELKPEDVQPWAEDLHRKRMDAFLTDAPDAACLPLGPLASAFHVDLIKLVQTPDMLLFLYPDLTYRQVFMDGRELEADPEPSWMGYSVGHWDGDTLVVETNGYNDRSWLDGEGHPHSTQLKVTERLRRTIFGFVDMTVTYEDPAVYKKPMTAKTRLLAAADTELLEYVCAENERDRGHFIGRSSDTPPVTLEREALAKLAGRYNLPVPGSPLPLLMPVVLTERGLQVDHPMFGAQDLRPLGQGFFAGPNGTFIFGEENGRVTLTLRAVEGDFKAIRQ